MPTFTLFRINISSTTFLSVQHRLTPISLNSQKCISKVQDSHTWGSPLGVTVELRQRHLLTSIMKIEKRTVCVYLLCLGQYKCIYTSNSDST